METRRLLLACTVAGAVGVVVGYLAVALMPLDTILLWEGIDRRARQERWCSCSAICLGLFVSFLPVGMVIATLFARRPEDINRLYFSDLAGAALACVVVVPLMAWIGPSLRSSALRAILLGVAIRLAERRDQVLRVVAAAGIALLAVVVVRPSVAPEIRAEASKGLRPDTETGASRWSALFRVDAVEINFDDETHDPNTLLFHDGIAGSAIWQWDGDPASLTRFDDDDRSVPFAALGTPPERMLIIGAAGGNEVQAAIHFGAEHIDAVELNPETASLLRGKYADYAGNVTTQPQVNYVLGDGRSYLAESDTDYDLIWFVAPDSYAASNAASSGAFVLSESYLYTQEMIEETLEHLTDARHGRDAVRRDRLSPAGRTARHGSLRRHAMRTTPRASTTVRPARRGDRRRSRRRSSTAISTTIMKRTPFTADELDRIEATATTVPTIAARTSPVGPATIRRRPSTRSSRSTTPQLGAFFDVVPVRRARHHRRPPVLLALHDVRRRDRRLRRRRRARSTSEIAVGERVLLLLLVIAVVLAAVFLLGPFLLARGTWKRLPDKGAVGAGASAILGLGFMLFEITLIQRFSLFLGYPTYSLTVTLMSILLFTGVGRVHQPAAGTTVRRACCPCSRSRSSVLGLFYMLVAPPITDALLDWPRLAKIGRGRRAVARRSACASACSCRSRSRSCRATTSTRREYVAWGWAINGFFSVIGSTLTTIVSMAYGFRTVLAISMVLYLVAIALLALLAQRRRVLT